MQGDLFGNQPSGDPRSADPATSQGIHALQPDCMAIIFSALLSHARPFYGDTAFIGGVRRVSRQWRDGLNQQLTEVKLGKLGVGDQIDTKDPSSCRAPKALWFLQRGLGGQIRCPRLQHVIVHKELVEWAFTNPPAECIPARQLAHLKELTIVGCLSQDDLSFVTQIGPHITKLTYSLENLQADPDGWGPLTSTLLHLKVHLDQPIGPHENDSIESDEDEDETMLGWNISHLSQLTKLTALEIETGPPEDEVFPEDQCEDSVSVELNVRPLKELRHLHISEPTEGGDAARTCCVLLDGLAALPCLESIDVSDASGWQQHEVVVAMTQRNVMAKAGIQLPPPVALGISFFECTGGYDADLECQLCRELVSILPHLSSLDLCIRSHKAFVAKLRKSPSAVASHVTSLTFRLLDRDELELSMDDIDHLAHEWELNGGRKTYFKPAEATTLLRAFPVLKQLQVQLPVARATEAELLAALKAGVPALDMVKRSRCNDFVTWRFA